MSNWFSKKIQESGIASKIQEVKSTSKEWISDTVENSDIAQKAAQKVSDGKKWASEKLDDSASYQAMQDKLAVAIKDEFGNTISRRETYYKTSHDKRPSYDSIDLMIKNCALKNAAISGGSSLIPGPWGMVAVVPEIAQVMRNQMELVYDIGVACGKTEVINKELLLAIFLTAMGTGGAGLIVMHGGKILVKRSSLQIFQKIVNLLAGKITQSALKSAVSKWVPLVGAMFMAWVSGKLTESIGQKAKEMFSQEIEVSKEELIESVANVEIEVPQNSQE